MALETRLSTPQRVYVESLLAGLSQQAAAAAAGVAPRTGQRWAQRPAVRAALAAGQDAALFEAAVILGRDARAMLDVLREIAESRESPASCRVRAALGWLEVLFRARELLDLAQRVDEIERRLAEVVR
jgi:phage terminase small subunit